MNYCGLNFNDIANGTGVRVSLFVSGCRNKCKGCFNPEAWDFQYGELFTEDTKKKIFDHMTDYHSGISILGGEPFEPENIETIKLLIFEFKERFPQKSIWMYSGYRYEDLIVKHLDVLNRINVLVDGKFKLSKRDISLKFKGSSNQRIIDVQKSTINNIVLMDI